MFRLISVISSSSPPPAPSSVGLSRVVVTCLGNSNSLWFSSLGRIHCWEVSFPGIVPGCHLPLPAFAQQLSAAQLRLPLFRAVLKARDGDLFFYVKEKEIYGT